METQRKMNASEIRVRWQTNKQTWEKNDGKIRQKKKNYGVIA